MKIQTIELRERKRLDLGKSAPLAAPLSLYLEPTSLCNMRCDFCPTGDTALRRRRPNGIMSLDLLTKIVDDIRHWGVKLRRINIYKDGDPLVHPRFIDFLRILRDGDIADELWTKTNGLSLNPELNQKLVESGVGMIGISINAVSSEGYMQVTRTRVDYAKLVDNVNDLIARARGSSTRVFVKIADSGFSEGELQKFHDDFSAAEHTSVEQLHGWAASYEKDWTLGTNPTTFEGAPLTNKIACPLPFFMLAVNWNGTVSLCNDDWLHATTCGDLNQQSLREVWEGERLRELRLMHLRGDRAQNPACRDCSNIRTLIDTIDQDRDAIAGRIVQGLPVEVLAH